MEDERRMIWMKLNTENWIDGYGSVQNAGILMRKTITQALGYM